MSDAKKNTHEENVIEFVTKLKQKYHEEHHDISYTKNNLPLTKEGNTTRKDSIYRPDILIKEKGNITHIIEIETKDGGKSLIGALFLADACISKHIELKRQDSAIKPELIFVILGNIDNVTKRIDAIKPQLNSITHIDYHFCTKKDASNILFGN